MGFWPFDPLQPGEYDVISIDPPWTFELYSAKGEEKSAQKQYACMTLDAIKALPVRGLGKPDSLFAVWVTNPMLPLQLDTVSAWGLRYVTMLTWRKITKHGKVAFGTGFVGRCATEHIIIAARGSPKTTRSTRTVFDGLIREHSRKPDEAYTVLEKLMPGARRADVFARESRAGWESFGNESTKFDKVAP